MKTMSLLFGNIALVSILLIGFPVLISLFSLIPFSGCISEGNQFLVINGTTVQNGINLACKNSNTQPMVYLFMLLLFISIAGIVFSSDIDFSTSMSFAGISLFYTASILSIIHPVPYINYIHYTLLLVSGIGILMGARYL